MADRRRPKWEKPRAALAVSLAFGLWVIGGSVVFGEWNLVPFGLICAGGGVGIYGFDCLIHKLLSGRIRPPSVLVQDLWWASFASGAGGLLGLLAPLYVG